MNSVKEEYRGVKYIIEPLPDLSPELRDCFIKQARKDTHWAIDQALAKALPWFILSRWRGEDDRVFVTNDDVYGELQKCSNGVAWKM